MTNFLKLHGKKLEYQFSIFVGLVLCK